MGTIPREPSRRRGRIDPHAGWGLPSVTSMRKFIANSPTGQWRRLALGMALLLIAAGATLMQGLPRAERHEKRHEIDRLELEWRQAILQGDVNTMSSLLADDYVGITSNGTLQSKDETLASMRSGALHFESIQMWDRKIRFYGTTALVISRADVTGKAPDGPVSGSFRYTRVYVQDDKGAWHIVSFEASPIRDHGDKHEQ